MPGTCARCQLHSGSSRNELSEDRRPEQWRTLGVRALQRGRRWGDPGHLPVVLYARGVHQTAGLVATLVDFVRGRPAPARRTHSWPRSTRSSAHDASAAMREMDVPTLITFGARDLVCSTRFAEPLNSGTGGGAGGLRPSARTPASRGPRDLQPHHARLVCCISARNAHAALGVNHCSSTTARQRKAGLPVRMSQTPIPDDTRTRRPGACQRPQPPSESERKPAAAADIS